MESIVFKETVTNSKEKPSESSSSQEMKNTESMSVVPLEELILGLLLKDSETMLHQFIKQTKQMMCEKIETFF